MALKVHGKQNHPLTTKILIAAEYAGIPVELVTVKNQFVDSKSPEFLKLNPFGRIPTAETKDGPLFESNSILRYIARQAPEKKLFGGSDYEEALVNQWLDFVTSEIFPAFFQVVGPILGFFPIDQEKFKKGTGDLKKLIKIVDETLKKSKFLTGDNLTIADINMGIVIIHLFRLQWDEKTRKIFPNVLKWFENISAIPAWQKYFRKSLFYTKTAWLVEEKAAPAPKAEKKPAEPKAEKKPKKEDDDDEEAKPKEKAANPLDVLPPTKFNLFDFKTLFVNAANKQDALKFFWENYDPEGFSLYRVSYIKDEGEGKVLFLTNNLKNGFLQRLDHFRKYAFGVHGVYGEEPSLEIRGIWLWRGVGIPQEVADLDSYPYHTWEKLDEKNAAHKDLVTQYWTSFEEDKDKVEGLLARDVSYFK